MGYNFDLDALEGISIGGKKLTVGEAYEVAGQIMHLHETGKITSNPTPLGNLEAQGMARLAPAAAAELQHKRNQTQAQVTTTLGSSFTIGPNNTYHQAWCAALEGHQIQLPIWNTDMSWVFERTHKELLEVYGDNTESWKRSGKVVCPTGAHQLRTDWIVLPIVDHEAPII